MIKALDTFYKDLKKTTPYPIWTMIGLGYVVLAVGYAAIIAGVTLVVIALGFAGITF